MERDYSKLIKPKNFTVELVWNIYASATMPLNAPKIQYDETRKAFYAGFFEAFKIMTDYSGALSEDDAFTLLNRLQKESTEFFRKMTGGKA